MNTISNLRWLEVKVSEVTTNGAWPFIVKARDEQGWMVMGEFKTRKAAERAAEMSRTQKNA